MSSKKRVFIGITLPKNLKGEIIEKQATLKMLSLITTKAEDLHVTIIPPWFEEIENIPHLIKKLTDTIQTFKPFSVETSAIEIIKNKKSNKSLVWIRIKEKEELSKLRKALTESLNRYPDSRKYIPHITLGKFKESKANWDIKEKFTEEFSVNSLSILESKSTSGNDTYITLKKVPLTNDSKEN